MGLVTQVVGHLHVERRLQDRLGDAGQEPIGSHQIDALFSSPRHQLLGKHLFGRNVGNHQVVARRILRLVTSFCSLFVPCVILSHPSAFSLKFLGSRHLHKISDTPASQKTKQTKRIFRIQRVVVCENIWLVGRRDVRIDTYELVCSRVVVAVDEIYQPVGSV